LSQPAAMVLPDISRLVTVRPESMLMAVTNL
jgi:hypothetical protein